MDCNGHGTLVASLAAGLTYGVARQAIIVPVKVMGCDGTGSLAELVQGVYWILQRMTNLTNHARKPVVNLSLQSASTNPVMVHLVELLVKAGAVVVVAAGNNNGSACDYSPSNSPNCLVVGATTSMDEVMTRSNTGPCVTLYAPGESILGASMYSSTAFTVRSGTSMSTALVSGIIAGVWSTSPGLTNVQVMRRYVAERTVPVIGPNHLPLAQVGVLLTARKCTPWRQSSVVYRPSLKRIYQLILSRRPTWNVTTDHITLTWSPTQLAYDTVIPSITHHVNLSVIGAMIVLRTSTSTSLRIPLPFFTNTSLYSTLCHT